MLKKLLIGTAIAAGGTGLVMGTSALSYMRMGVASVRQGIKDRIPVEVEIQRAREMISQLKPEIVENLRVIKNEEVEVEKLASELDNNHHLLAKAKKDILKLKDFLESGSSHFVSSRRSYTCDEVRDDLANKFKNFQTQEATIGKLEKVLEAREKNLGAARQKLDAMLAAKRQLEVDVENLQARLTMVQVAETTSKLVVNDSQLSQTRKLLDEIGSKIDVAERMIHCEGLIDGGIQVDDELTSSKDLVGQITEYFGAGERAEIESLVRK